MSMKRLTISLWEITESEGEQEVEEEEESEDHEFTYQNLILENPESETLNFQTQPNLNNQKNDILNIQTPPNQNNLNPEVINQYLSPVIIINQPPIKPIGQPIQPQNQQNQQLPPQQQMAYAPITKLDKFNSEEDNAQDIADAWYQSLTVKLQNFNGFKTEFLWYFSNNNNINKLANTFTTIRQGDTEAVITYLGCFHRNLHQIQAIQADYFIVPQILNQFIRGLCMNLLTAITYARDFEAAELEANYTQAVNLAINGSSELDSKLKQFSGSINQKLERYLANNHTIYQPSQWCNNQGNMNRFQNQSHPLSSFNQSWQPEMHKPRLLVPDSKPSPESRLIPTHLPVYDAPTNLSTASLSNSSLSTTATSNLSGTATSNISTIATSNLLNTHHSNTTNKPSSNDIREPKIKDYPKLKIGNSCISTDPQLFSPTIRISLLVTSENATSSNQGIKQQQQPSTNNIPSATITKNESLNVIFSFELEEPSDMSLFKTDRAANARIIIADGATKTPIGKINDFSIEVNGIIVLIKVLIMEATQY
ncbi:hypothetical protein G9A89_012766 [Geosiphon pyriformis]|nr:hypothetical protein G9A89_012766 [Geosiphon pyriformis]